MPNGNFESNQADRLALLSSGGSSGALGTLLSGGIGILQDLIAARFGGISGGGGVQDTGFQPLVSSASPNLASLAAVSGAIIAAGGRIVGSVISISRAAWAAIPAAVKSAAAAIGLTVAFTDVGLPSIPGFNGSGDGLTNAQQKRLDKFQQLTGAGVPPNIAARAAGIGRRPRRGITYAQIKGFSRISGMLSKWGMVPRKMRGAKKRRVCK